MRLTFSRIGKTIGSILCSNAATCLNKVQRMQPSGGQKKPPLGWLIIDMTACRFAGRRSRWNRNPLSKMICKDGSFLHPYRAYCAPSHLDIKEPTTASAGGTEPARSVAVIRCLLRQLRSVWHGTSANAVLMSSSLSMIRMRPPSAVTPSERLLSFRDPAFRYRDLPLHKRLPAPNFHSHLCRCGCEA